MRWKDEVATYSFLKGYVKLQAKDELIMKLLHIFDENMDIYINKFPFLA